MSLFKPFFLNLDKFIQRTGPWPSLIARRAGPLQRVFGYWVVARHAGFLGVGVVVMRGGGLIIRRGEAGVAVDGGLS